jgi:hypothetical protein
MNNFTRLPVTKLLSKGELFTIFKVHNAYLDDHHSS